MRPSLRNFAAIFLLGIAAFMASQNGFFKGIDNTFREWRFSQHHVDATGDIALVDIDARSLHQLVCGHARWVYAGALSKLTELNAYEVAFDVDFSSRSTPENDAEFTKALEDAGGFTYLAALQQLGFGTSGDLQLLTNLPLPEFREHSELALVNVEPADDGLVWQFAKYGMIEERIVPSLPTVFSPKTESSQKNFFYIDYAIELESIDRIPFIDLLNGHVDPSRVEDKKIIIGASALELGDLLEVPHYGRIPGPLVQVLAAETRLLNRELSDAGSVLAWIVFIVLAGIVAQFRRPPIIRMAFAFIAVSLAVEFVAMELQAQFQLLSDTFWLHLGIVLTYILKVLEAMDIQRLLVRKVSGENSRMQAILDRVIADNFDGVIIIDSDLMVLAASTPARQMLGLRSTFVGSTSSVLPEKLFQEVTTALELAKQNREKKCRARNANIEAWQWR